MLLIGGVEARAQVADVTLDDVTIAAGEQSYEAPRLIVRGTTLSKAEIERILDPAAAEPLAGRVARLNASSIDADGLRSYVVTARERQETVYREVRIGPVAAGRIGAIAVSGGTTRTVAEGREVSTGSFGRFELRDMDLGLALSLFAVGGAPGMPLKAVYASFAMEDLRIRDRTGTEVRLGRISGRDFLARPTAAGWIGSARLLADTPDLAKASPENRRRALDTMAEFLDAVSIGSIEVTDVSIAGQGAGATRIARIGYTGAGQGGTGAALTLEGLDAATPTWHVRIATMAAGGLTAKPLMDAMRESDAWLGGRPDPQAARAFASMLSSFRMGGLESDGPGEASAPGLGPPTRPSGWRMALASAELAGGQPINGLPSDLRLALKNLSFGVPANPENDALRQLASLGYGEVDGSLGLDLGWSEAEHQLTIRDLSLDGAGMGSVTIKGALGSVSRDIFDRDTAVASVAMIGAAAKSLDVSVDNRGLFERIVAREASRQKRSPEQVRRDYGTAAALGIPALLGASPAGKDLGQAVATFVARPGRLTIRARAKQPAGYGAADFAASPDPAAVLEAFDVTATAE